MLVYGTAASAAGHRSVPTGGCAIRAPSAEVAAFAPTTVCADSAQSAMARRCAHTGVRDRSVTNATSCRSRSGALGRFCSAANSLLPMNVLLHSFCLFRHGSHVSPVGLPQRTDAGRAALAAWPRSLATLVSPKHTNLPEYVSVDPPLCAVLDGFDPALAFAATSMSASSS